MVSPVPRSPHLPPATPGPSTAAGPVDTQAPRASTDANPPLAARSGGSPTRLVAPRQATLGGTAVTPASLSNLQRLARQAPPPERLAWAAALALLRQDGFMAHPGNLEGQPQRFGRPAKLPDGRRATIALVAQPREDGRLEMSDATFRDEASGAIVARRLTSEDESAQDRWVALHQAALAQHGPDINPALAALADLGDELLAPPPLGLGFPVPGLIDVAGRRSGDDTLRRLHQLAAGLMAAAPEGLGATPDELIAVATIGRGSANLRMLGQLGLALTRPEGPALPAAGVLAIAAGPDGAGALAELHEYGVALVAPGPLGLAIPAEDLVAMASRPGASTTLRKLDTSGRALSQALERPVADIMRFLRYGTNSTMEALHAVAPDLREAGMPVSPLLQAANRQAGTRILQALRTRLPDLRAGRMGIERLTAALLPPSRALQALQILEEQQPARPDDEA